ncbi:MAG: transposase [Cephaloticoccus sp.]|nr:transposase [Cephaloticoccus sp.]MCF7760869.1 transposase [Cephaloticoccus sp.]
MERDPNASIYPPHLGRLDEVWVRNPVYFITTCVSGRRSLLADPCIAEHLCHEWRGAETRHGWLIGRYVIMPDHVHFFAVPTDGAKGLSTMVGRWKEWTAKAVLRHINQTSPLWQHRFFDHVLRSRTSYAEKWNYVQQNPVRRTRETIRRLALRRTYSL